MNTTEPEVIDDIEKVKNERLEKYAKQILCMRTLLARCDCLFEYVQPIHSYDLETITALRTEVKKILIEMKKEAV